MTSFISMAALDCRPSEGLKNPVHYSHRQPSSPEENHSRKKRARSPPEIDDQRLLKSARLSTSTRTDALPKETREDLPGRKLGSPNLETNSTQEDIKVNSSKAEVPNSSASESSIDQFYAAEESLHQDDQNDGGSSQEYNHASGK